MDKKRKRFKITLITLVSIFALLLFGFGLFMVIYNYDIYTVVFGVILIIISAIIVIGDILLIVKWEPKDKLEATYGDNPEIKQLEKEIEEIRKKHNV